MQKPTEWNSLAQWINALLDSSKKEIWSKELASGEKTKNLGVNKIN